jgi:hypothetical protein
MADPGATQQSTPPPPTEGTKVAKLMSKVQIQMWDQLAVALMSEDVGEGADNGTCSAVSVKEVREISQLFLVSNAFKVPLAPSSKQGAKIHFTQGGKKGPRVGFLKHKLADPYIPAQREAIVRSLVACNQKSLINDHWKQLCTGDDGDALTAALRHVPPCAWLFPLVYCRARVKPSATVRLATPKYMSRFESTSNLVFCLGI